MIMVSPVIQLAASETRNATALAMSAGSPIRPSAMVAANGSSWSFHSASASLVRTTPGQIAFTRMRGESSSASCLVTWISAALVALYMPMAGDWCIPPMEAVLTTAPPCSPIHAVTTSEVHISGAHRLTSKILAKPGVVLLEQRTVSRVGSGVVDQDVNAAEALEGEVHTTPGGILVDRVCTNAQGAVADLCSSLVGSFLPACGEHHMGAGSCQLLGDGKPDASRCASNYGGAAGQIQ